MIHVRKAGKEPVGNGFETEHFAGDDEKGEESHAYEQTCVDQNGNDADARVIRIAMALEKPDGQCEDPGYPEPLHESKGFACIICGR